jgi:hypothetical protein
MATDTPQRPERKKSSTLKLLIYALLAFLLLTLILELTGAADVAGQRETEEIIDRPHQVE